MSRIARWKIEKTKVKVVFRLQFHATHIPQSGWDKLFISFIPADSGKATSKTTKANVRNGTCKWADPIYETTRLLQDIKTRQYDEKLYKLVVGMGSSRSSILGEADINLADFADALKPIAVALPLHGCEAGTTLHVTVQLLTSKTGFREFEQQRELRERGLQTTSDQGTPDESADSKESSPDKNLINHMDKVSARVKFKRQSKEVPCASSIEGEAGVNEDCADSPIGFDGSSTASESLYPEKHDISSMHEVDSFKKAISGDLGGLSISQNPQPEKGDSSDNQFSSRGTDWVHSWSIDYSSANVLAAESEDNSTLKGSLDAVESSILDLKLEVSSLQNHADELGVETQKFAEQIAAEISSGEELAKEVAVLKSECSKFKDEFERLKSSKLSFAYTVREPIEADQSKLFQNSKSKWFRGLLLMEDKLIDVQKKVSMGFYDRDISFLSLELEALVEVLQDLKKESGEAVSGTSVANGRESKEIALHKEEEFLTGAGSDIDLFHPEDKVHYLSIPGLMSLESDSVDSTLAMKGKLFELVRELDESKTERENLARKMDQMECYYEALVQELEQNQRQMMGEMQNLRNEHSICLYTISSSKTEMERMHQNMNDQLMKFAEEKRILDSLNNKLERRALSAEAALKRARLNYSIAVGQLQKDLELLSCQVLSMYETNENLIKQAFSDSSLLRPESCPETVKYQKISEEGHGSDEFLCQNKNAASNKQHSGEDILLMDLKRSLHVQEGLYKQVEEEVCQMHSVNVYLDVFSKALQETLLEASVDFQLVKERIDQLSQQLQLSTESKELLMLRLENVMNDINSLNVYNASCIAKSNDIAQQNQMLETNFKNLAHENHLLTQKINNLEGLLTECRSYESKYLACSTENLELKNFLNHEIAENDHLRDEKSILQEELKAIRTEFDVLVSMKDNQQNVISSVSNKLQKLLTSYDYKYSELSLCCQSICQDSDSEDLEGLLLQLEEVQQSACSKILMLIEEKKILQNEKHMAQASLSTAESDILIMKQKFEHDLQEMVSNLSVSSALLQKLQLEFEVIVNRLKAGSDFEEFYSQNHKEIFSGLDQLEAELQQLNSRNQDLAQEISRLDTLSGDLEMCKLTVTAITEEKEALVASLQDKTEECAKISSELNSMKDSLHSLHDELLAERIFREKLEKTVTDLTSQLNKKQCQLLDFGKNEKELVALEASLQEKTEECAKISSEFNFAKESLCLLNDELHDERMIKEKLEKTVTDLTSQLNEKQIQLLDFGKNEQELVALEVSLQEKTEECAKISLEFNLMKESLHSMQGELHAERIIREKLEKTVSDLTSQLNVKQIQLLDFGKNEKKLVALEVSLQEKTEECAKISTELSFLKESLHSLHDELHSERTFRENLETAVTDLNSQLNEKQAQLLDFENNEKKVVALDVSLQEKTEECAKISSELSFLKESLHSLHDELHSERALRQNLETTVTHLTSQLNEKQCQLLDFEKNEKKVVALEVSLQEKTEECAKISSELSFLKESLHSLHDELHSERTFRENLETTVTDLNLKLNEKQCQLLDFEKNEKKVVALEVSLQEKTEECAKISSELTFVKESLCSLQHELHAEKTFREKLEKSVTDLTSQLNEKQLQQLDSGKNKEELVALKQLVKDLESQKLSLSQLLRQSEECLKEVLRDSSTISCLETQISELHEFSIASDVTMIFTRAQFGGHIEELGEKLNSTCRQLDVLHKKNLDVESELNGCLYRESTYIEENARLLTSLDSLKSDLEASAAQNRALVDQNSAIIAELEEYKNRAETTDRTSCIHESQCGLEAARLEHLLASCSEEVEDLFFSKEEAEVKCIVLQVKLDELKTSMILMKQSNDELTRLQNQCSELTKRLSEQVLKTEEFKNLSIHLKELKDKAEAECHDARERRGNDGPPVAMQESLRIAFIKEQYETKLQELKQQFSASKKHSEEMLWKLQDAIDEIENRKKSEASHIKRNEELGKKILEVEAKLQVVLSEKRNLLNAYDLIKAEKECSAMSLECCKQEKQELEASLLKCNDEKSKIALELILTKKLVENSRSHLSVQDEGGDLLQKMTCPSDEPVEEKLHAGNLISDIPNLGTDIVNKVPGNHSSVDSSSDSSNHKKSNSTHASTSEDPETSHILAPEDALVFRGTNGCQTVGNSTEEDVLQNEQKHVTLTGGLQSSMELLNKELERMKNENLLPPVDDHNYEPSFPGLQRELMKLHEANKELGNIFPMFNEICLSGNALERVLALEIELAEALQAKKKSSFQFQSSFLKQHSDEEAIFRSFRVINELIKDMLELKARHAAVETELKEMHDRYSQLSLDFAEVEGERQKLVMTLKNNRGLKKALQTLTSFGDPSS